MRGNPHVRFLEGKMAVMSSSYSTSMHLLPGARHIVLNEEACGAADQTCGIIADWLK